MLLLDRSATKPAGKGGILPLIGLIWAAIWQVHWLCIMEERLWIHESCLARIRNERFNVSMSINRTAKIEDDSLMPMATSYEKGSNKPIHTRFAYRRDVIAFRGWQIAWVPILVPV
jgi:hypothetical protein